MQEHLEAHPDTESGGGRREFLAPARVNLLGEHTDYTGGLVLPIAIPFVTWATITASSDAHYTFTSERFEGTRSFLLEDASEAIAAWSDYPIGVLLQLQRRGIVPPPFHLNVRSDVPMGAGLSSSASLEVASAWAMLAHAGASLPWQEIAILCRAAENEYVHSPCGIMDQFVITAARAGHALLLDTGTLRTEFLPLGQSLQFVICNSMVKHSIATGEYGQRRREVQEGESVMLARYPSLKNLGQATLEQLAACKEAMPLESFARCRHIITENARVRAAKGAMLAGDAVRMGELMLLSHASQRDDFACSTPEIDFLVDTAAKLPGCFGARLTGGGFGGCTVNLVQHTEAGRFADVLKTAYRERFGIDAETYLCEAVDGAVLRNAKLRNASVEAATR